MKIVGIAVAIALLSFTTVTWLALEWSEVAVITTRAPAGKPRETHVWYVRDGGDLWLEAGTPQNPWFLDVEANPSLSLKAENISGEYRVEVVPGREAANRVRKLLAQKYGLRDRWVGLLVDAAGSVAVRLHPR